MSGRGCRDTTHGFSSRPSSARARARRPRRRRPRRHRLPPAFDRHRARADHDHGSTGDIGGYSLYLKADDGNTYYYTHLTAYAPELENTQRVVAAGDVIESVNHTGNANGFDHLHFE